MFYVIEEQIVSHGKGHAMMNYAYVVEHEGEIAYRVVSDSSYESTISIVAARCLDLNLAKNVARRAAYDISFGADGAVNAGVRYDDSFGKMIRDGMVAGVYMAGERPQVGHLEIDDELSRIIFECGRSNKFFDSLFIVRRLASYVASKTGLYVSSDSIARHVRAKYLETKDSSGFDTISEFLRIEHQWVDVLANAMQEMVVVQIDWIDFASKQRQPE